MGNGYCDMTDVTKVTSVEKKQLMEQASSRKIDGDDEPAVTFHKWFVNSDCNLSTNLDMMMKNIESTSSTDAVPKGNVKGKGTGKGKPEKADPFVFDTLEEGFDVCKALATIMQNRGHM